MDETLYKELRKYIDGLSDLTARVEERVKISLEKLNTIDRKLDTLTAQQNKLDTKVHIIESNPIGDDIRRMSERLMDDMLNTRESLREFEHRLSQVESMTTKTEARWKGVFDSIYRGLWVIIVCWALYKLDLSTPPLP